MSHPAAFVLVFLAATPIGAEPSGPPAPQAGMGIMVGGVTATTALVQVRLTSGEELVDGDVSGVDGVVVFTLAATEGGGAASKTVVQGVPANADRDFIARAAFGGLTPGARYRCTTQIGANERALRPGPTARFRTHPGPDARSAVRFAVVTGMNYAKFHGDNRIDKRQHLIENNTALPAPYDGPDKHLGYPGLEAIRAAAPDFFVGTGDNVYYDTPDTPRAETVPEMRRKWHEQFVQPRFRELFAAVPTCWMIDDHDYRIDDGDNTGDHLPWPDVARRVMLEQLPLAPAGDLSAKTYRTHRVSRDLQVWMTEHRMHRSPNAMPDGPEKSIWGAEQKAWLKRTLRESDATFKVLISPTPMIGPDDLRKRDNHTNVGGFRHERDEFFAWLKREGIDRRGFVIVCGDRHWQYHAVDPIGIEEFSCGALVDANSRLGRKPGDPKSTDPEGLIRQPYYQTPRSGGFLLVESTPGTPGAGPRLAFVFHDERGVELYRHVKTAGGGAVDRP